MVPHCAKQHTDEGQLKERERNHQKNRKLKTQTTQ